MTTLVIALAGAAGAVSRYRLGLLAGDPGWPWPTLAINVIGSLLAGLVLGMGTARLSPTTSAAITVGFLGAFTTFSAFSVQTVTMLREGRTPAASTYVVGSVVLGLAAAYTGLRLGERVAGA